MKKARQKLGSCVLFIVKSLQVLAILGLASCTIPRNGMAQSAWRLELLGGGNWEELTASETFQHYQSPIAPVVEVGVNRAFGKYFSLDVRAEYIRRSFENSYNGYIHYNITDVSPMRFQTGPTDTSNFTNAQELNYLQFPLTVRLSVPIGPFRPFAFAGIAPGFFLSGHEHLHDYDSSYYGDGVFYFDSIMDPKEAVNSFYFSLVGGLGMSVDFSERLSILLEGTYEYGVSSISNGYLSSDYQYISDYPHLDLTPLFNNPLRSRDIHFEVGIAVDL